jgi:hypothetical protein
MWKRLAWFLFVFIGVLSYVAAINTQNFAIRVPGQSTKGVWRSHRLGIAATLAAWQTVSTPFTNILFFLFRRDSWACSQLRPRPAVS